MIDSISYIVPAHNGEKTLGAIVETIVDRLNDQSPGSEVLIVENGSSDDTARVAAALVDRYADTGRTAVKYLTSPVGLGNAMRVGVANSAGDLVVMAGGLAFGFTDLDAALVLDPRAEFVIGSKAHPDSQLERPLIRRISTAGFKVARRVLFSTTIGDSQGSFVIDGTLARRLFPLTVEPSYVAQAEVVLLAELAGIRIVEVPVVLDARGEGSSVHPVRTSAEMASGLVRLRRRMGAMRRELDRVGFTTVG